MPGSRRRSHRRRRSPSPGPDHPYEYITLPGGGHFDIPEGDTKEEWIDYFERSARATRENIARYGDGRPADGINRASILPDSTHRDGAIYTVFSGWKVDYRISETNETSEPASKCVPSQETCTLSHCSSNMLQIFSIRLGKISVDCGGPVQIYGYIAARDTNEALRNYVFNRSRDDPVTVEEGSLIGMTGPKRGIDAIEDVLIEYDLRIKKGEDELDDMQLIDGVSDFMSLSMPHCFPFLSRIDGVGGAVDVTLTMIFKAAEATIQVDMSQVSWDGCRLFLTSLSSGVEDEIHLFHGVVTQPCRLRRFVVAVMLDTWMHLKFKFVHERGGLTKEVECGASFKAQKHGCVSQQICCDDTFVTVNVTWATTSAY